MLPVLLLLCLHTNMTEVLYSFSLSHKLLIERNYDMLMV